MTNLLTSVQNSETPTEQARRGFRIVFSEVAQGLRTARLEAVPTHSGGAPTDGTLDRPRGTSTFGKKTSPGRAKAETGNRQPTV
jgi:hypothetical protein